MLVTHDAFSIFGYGFGDIEALTDMHFVWLTVPIMSGVGACNIFCWFSVIYNKCSCLCRAGLLCIPNLRVVKVTNRPDIRDLCSSMCSFFVTIWLIYSQVSLTSTIAITTGAYSFEAGNVLKLNNRRTSVAVGVSICLGHPVFTALIYGQIWCGASALCDIIIAICMTYYVSPFTGFRRTRLLVTKLIRLTVETGSVTGMFSVSSNVLARITPPTFSCCRSAQPYPFLWVPSSCPSCMLIPFTWY